MGQTVNLLVFTFGGSNPSLPTNCGAKSDANFCTCGSSSVDRALAFQAKGREFEPRLPLSLKTLCNAPFKQRGIAYVCIRTLNTNDIKGKTFLTNY